jgi:murein DD-endopeptidase MepM/ murein hydrolase activator NlpD
MAKNNENINSNKTVIYSIFIILVFLLIITVAGMKIAQDKSESERLAQSESSNQYSSGAEDENIAKADTSASANASEDTNETAQEDAQTTTAQKTVSLDDISDPVSSKEITMAYSYNTSPVYSPTLNEYRSDHMGADISAQAGEEVKAAMDGKIEKIYDDGKLGRCVVIDHGSNIKTVYGNLNESVSVSEGQVVTKGAVIGKVGATAKFEIDDPSHLHFEIWQDGKSIDPALYIK